MARALIYTAPGQGHALPPIPTALAMHERGHDVSVHTVGENVPALERHGLEAVPLDSRIEAIRLEDWRTRTPVGALVSAFRTFDERARYEIPDLQAAIKAERPDVLWVDCNATGASAAAAASGLPWAHLMPYPYPIPASGVPAFGPGFAPSASPLALLRDSILNGLKPLAFGSFLRRHNDHRAALGLQRLEKLDHYFEAPDLTILLTVKEFEHHRPEWPARVRLVGPSIWERETAEPPWLAGEERPIVLVTASTEFQDDAKLIRCTLEAFADSPYAIVATTAAHDPAEFDAPANARIERRLPHTPILRRATVVISHGGMGTTQKALAAGVPVCVVPFMRDQFEVARRVEQSGAGVFLRPRRLSPDRLRSAVGEAIACRPGAEQIRDAIARAGGAEAAASELEALAQGLAPADLHTLPADLPVPEDDGGADHLPGAEVPAISLTTTAGEAVDLGAAARRETLVVYLYPRTGTPGQPLPEGWDEIPGARGCTPQSCAFRDSAGELAELGANVYGLSAQPLGEQREFAGREGIPYPLLNDSDFRLAEELGLPTFNLGGVRYYRRLTFIARESRVAKVFYPVFPPQDNAADVIAWIRRSS